MRSKCHELSFSSSATARNSCTPASHRPFLSPPFPLFPPFSPPLFFPTQTQGLGALTCSSTSSPFALRRASCVNDIPSELFFPPPFGHAFGSVVTHSVSRLFFLCFPCPAFALRPIASDPSPPGARGRHRQAVRCTEGRELGRVLGCEKTKAFAVYTTHASALEARSKRGGFEVEMRPRLGEADAKGRFARSPSDSASLFLSLERCGTFSSAGPN